MSKLSPGHQAIKRFYQAGLSVRDITEKLNTYPTAVPTATGARWHLRSVQLAIEDLRTAGELPKESPDPIRANTARNRAAGEVPGGRGRHVLPRRQLVGTEDQWAEWDEKAKAAGYRTWSEWVRDLQDRA